MQHDSFPGRNQPLGKIEKMIEPCLLCKTPTLGLGMFAPYDAED
jgi:hypothetical protein